MHLAYIWIVSHLSAKNYRNWWKFDEVLTKTNLLSFFGGTRCSKGLQLRPPLRVVTMTKKGDHFLEKKVKSSVTAPGDTNISDATKKITELQQPRNYETGDPRQQQVL